jgi:hypothetical protein
LKPSGAEAKQREHVEVLAAAAGVVEPDAVAALEIEHDGEAVREHRLRERRMDRLRRDGADRLGLGHRQGSLQEGIRADALQGGGATRCVRSAVARHLQDRPKKRLDQEPKCGGGLRSMT